MYTGIEPSEVVIATGTNRKPYFQNNPDVQFNVSHSGDWVVLAFSSFPVGVDCEQLDPNFNFTDILDSYFNQVERNFIVNSALPVRSFYQLWTRKEAFLKLIGVGIDENIVNIPSLDGVYDTAFFASSIEKNRVVTSFTIAGNCIGCIASILPIGQVYFLEADSFLLQSNR